MPRAFMLTISKLFEAITLDLATQDLSIKSNPTTYALLL